MKTITQSLLTLIVPFKALFVVSLVLTIVLAIQIFTYLVILDDTVVWEGTCSFKSWDDSGTVGLVVDCGEKGNEVLSDSDFVRSYLKNPGLLMCKLSAADNISCDQRPPLEGDNS